MNFDDLVSDGREWVARNRFRKAIECFEVALDLTSGEGFVDLGLELAPLYRKLGDGRGAMGIYKRVLEVERGLNEGKGSETEAGVLFLMGGFLEGIWKRKGAFDLYTEAYEVAVRVMGADSENARVILERLDGARAKLEI